MNYAFRITKSYEELGLALLPLYDICDRVAVYEHEADTEVSRTHVHGVLIGCKRKEDTVRNKFFKGVYDAPDYELKTKYKTAKMDMVPVDAEYIKYMSKGDLDPSFFKGFTQEELDNYRRGWVNHKLNESVAEKTSKKSQLTVYEMAVEIMGTDATAHLGLAREDIVDKIIKYLNSKRQAANMYKVRDIYDACMMYSRPQKYVQGCMALIVKRDGEY